MPIEVGRTPTPEEEAEMLVHVAIFRDAVAALAEMLDLGDQPDDAAPTESTGLTGEDA
jgi:hypothetical protein